MADARHLLFLPYLNPCLTVLVFFFFIIIITVAVVSAVAIRSTMVLLVLLMCSMSLTVVVMQEKVVAPRALVQPGEGMGGREEGRKYPLLLLLSGFFRLSVTSCRTISTKTTPRNLHTT